MSMYDTHVHDEDGWIEAEIQRQLDALSPEQLDHDKKDEDPPQVQQNDTEPSEGNDFLLKYTSGFAERLQNFEEELEECDIYMKQADEVSAKRPDDVLEMFVQEVSLQEGEDKDVIRKYLLEEIEKENNLSEDESEEITDFPVQHADPSGATEENGLTLKPEEGVMVEFQETVFLEHAMRKQLKELEDKQRKRDEFMKQQLEIVKSEEQQWEKEVALGRTKKREELEKQKEKSTQEQLIKQAETEKEFAQKKQKFEESMREMETEITKLAELTNKEKEEYVECKRQEEEKLRTKRVNAAVCIQSAFRGSRTRKTYAPALESSKRERLKMKNENRIKEVETQREQRKFEETRKKEDEQKIKMKEEIRVAEEKRKAEEERKKKEGELLEKKRLEEEEKRKREEEEARILREEEAKKIEEERKQEEMRRQEQELKLEEEQIRQEKIKKLKEAKEREEEERRLVEERRKKEEIRRREEEMKMLEDEKMEEQRLAAEKLRIEEEKIKQDEEERLRAEDEERMAEQRRDIEKKKAENNEGKLSDDAEEKRLRWMGDCKPWSETQAEFLNKKIVTNKRAPRRPASTKKLPLLSEDLISNPEIQSTMQEVTTVVLRDLPGSNLNTLSQCSNLVFLTMTNCGIVALDGLEGCPHLKHANVQNNKIEMIFLPSQSELVYLDLSHNSLTSIFGLESCASLRYLNLGRNKITKLGGLTSLNCLHTLLVDHNQLISTRGLSDVCSLQVLDMSHNNLPSIEDVEMLGLLQILRAHSNTIKQFPMLDNHVLLHEIILDDNNISSIECIRRFWLPRLQHLGLAENGLLDVDGVQNLILLEILDIRHNQIIEEEGLPAVLAHCKHLRILCIEGNPVNEDEAVIESLSKAVTSLKQLDSLAIYQDANIKACPSSSFEKLCLAQVSKCKGLKAIYQEDIRKLLSSAWNSELLNAHNVYYTASHNQAVKDRCTHEYGDTSTGETVVDQQYKQDDNRLLTPVPLNGQNAASPAVVIGEQKMELTIGEQHKYAVNRGPQQAPTLDRRLKRPGMLESRAAVIIQATWRGYRVRRNLDTEEEMWWAAMKIQALWRGFRLRKRLAYALNYAKADAEEEHDFEVDEIDLTAFDVNEDDLDIGWIPPDTPQLPTNHAVIGGRPPSGKSLDGMPYTVPHPPNQPRHVWRDSPTCGGKRSVTPIGRPPRPPSSSLSGADTHRSGMSRKEEKLSEEWGFKDARTAELMVQRAKKLKYNSERKKKWNKLDPKQRLALFRKMEDSSGGVSVHVPQKKGAQKREYFRARENEERNRNIPQNSEEKNIRTFEWLHTQVGPIETVEAPNRMQPSYHGSDSNLPQMSQDVIEGGRVNLMGSPLSLHSVSTVNSGVDATAHRRRHSVSGQRAEKRLELPPIKTNSAPTNRVKERMSRRNPATDTDPGWGGGKKRSTYKI